MMYFNDDELTIGELLILVVSEAVKKCYKEEKSLIALGMEQACVARIFYHMQDMINRLPKFKEFKDFNLDSEYSKVFERVSYQEDLKSRIQPDIVLYRRDSDEDNFLVIEFKSKKDSNTIKAPYKDRLKLEKLTSHNSEYKFRLGIFVRLDLQEPKYVFSKWI